jgi:hypothetical protein
MQTSVTYPDGIADKITYTYDAAGAGHFEGPATAGSPERHWVTPRAKPKIASPADGAVPQPELFAEEKIESCVGKAGSQPIKIPGEPAQRWVVAFSTAAIRVGGYIRAGKFSTSDPTAGPR